jgi:hypothetical protein
VAPAAVSRSHWGRSRARARIRIVPGCTSHPNGETGTNILPELIRSQNPPSHALHARRVLGVLPWSMIRIYTIPGCTTSAVTIPYIPCSDSAWGRMWQWNAQVPGLVAFTITSHRSPGAMLSVSHFQGAG